MSPAHDASSAECPSCGGPLSRHGTFCKACGYEAGVNDSEDAYLDGIEVPEGYAGTDWDAAAAAEIARARRRRQLILGAIVSLLIVLWLARGLRFG